MNYATIATHFLPIAHYLAAFLFLFILMPKWLFPTSYTNWSDRLLSGYVKMVFLIIISGYLLVLTKLYEVISLIALFLFIIGYRIIKSKNRKRTETKKEHLLGKSFDVLDGLNQFTLSEIKKNVTNKINLGISYPPQFHWRLIVEGLVLALIIGGSAYLRFYDAFSSAALPMADSYLTLEWMKYINARELFADGIYPQGFHIYLATLFKFAAVDALFILKYTGPLNAILLILLLYLVIRKLTNSGIGALTGAWIYGLLWVTLPFSPVEIERQVAINSQEFSFVFIFPAIYFFIKYVLNRHKEDLIVGLMCSTIIGLVHSLAFALVFWQIGVLAICSLLILKTRLLPVLKLGIGTLLTVLISLTPLGIGYLLGKKFHSSSAKYFMERKDSEFTVPELTFVDYSTIGLCSLLFLSLFRKTETNQERFIVLFTVVAGLSVFLLYYAGGAWTQSTLIANRSHELWGLFIPFCIGISLSHLGKRLKEKWVSILSFSLLSAMVSLFFFYRPTPIIPYKQEYAENIEQYLKIRHEYLPTTWMIVSQSEGYSVSLGTGLHMYLDAFLQNYSPQADAFQSVGKESNEPNHLENIFVFMEKNVFQDSEFHSLYDSLKSEQERKKLEFQQLSEWMQSHMDAGYKVTTYFENENIRIYHIQ